MTTTMQRKCITFNRHLETLVTGRCRPRIFLLCLTLTLVPPSQSQQTYVNSDSDDSPTTVTEGSTTISRQQTDQDPGQVYIYVGGMLPKGTRLNSLHFMFDLTTGGNTSGYITPLLFERVPSEIFNDYIVRGIGQGFSVNLNSMPQTINFTVLQGIDVTPNANYTFGFINALVDSNGVPTQTSQGVVVFDNPGDSGHGVGGQHTSNDWVATGIFPPPAVPLGAAFGLDVGFGSFFLPYRTYSAQVSGTVRTDD